MPYHWRSAPPAVLTRYLYVGAPAGSGVTWSASQLQGIVTAVSQYCGSSVPEESIPAQPVWSADTRDDYGKQTASNAGGIGSNHGGTTCDTSTAAPSHEAGKRGCCTTAHALDGMDSLHNSSTAHLLDLEGYSGCYLVFATTAAAEAALLCLHTAAQAAGPAAAAGSHSCLPAGTSHNLRHGHIGQAAGDSLVSPAAQESPAHVDDSNAEEVTNAAGRSNSMPQNDSIGHISCSSRSSSSLIQRSALLRVPGIDIPLVIGYAERRTRQPPQVLPVASTTAESLNIPGLFLLRDFVTVAEEQALLAAVDAAEWVDLAKRRVQHYGYAFEYAMRSINVQSPLGPLPEWATQVSTRIESLPAVDQALDQLTVNEYAPGVGLSAHIDTHSAFTGAIVSLSLAGAAAMELRRGDTKHLLALPPRSLLVLSGEARYAWQHMIPHRKADVVEGRMVSRQPRRVSLTFRKVRGSPCTCAYPEHCDSQASTLPPTRLAQLQAAQAAVAAPVLPAPNHRSTDCNTAMDTASGMVACSSTAIGSSIGGAGSGSSTAGGGSGGAGPSNSSASDGVVGDSTACSSVLYMPTLPVIPTLLSTSTDAAAEQSPAAMSEQQLSSLEMVYVHRVYDAIAPHFSSTRFSIWPKVRAFIHSLAPGSLVADVGCGNGKYFGVRRDIAVLGSDRSSGLAQVAAVQLQSKPEASKSACSAADVLVADGLVLPYRPASFDAVLCIAVLHHISSSARRLRLLQQLIKVLRPGGRALVTVWAAEQEDPERTLQKWHRIDVQPNNVAPCTPAACPLQAQGRADLHALNAAASMVDATASMGRSMTQPTATASQQTEASANVTGQGILSSIQKPSLVACARGGLGGSVSSTTPLAHSTLDGGDYFVPWHLPVHRAEGKRALLALQGEERQRAVQAAEGTLSTAAESGENFGHPSLENAKGAVVFQRYYHLFACGELQLLATGLGSGVRIVDTFYDRSNWCIVLERCA